MLNKVKKNDYLQQIKLLEEAFVQLEENIDIGQSIVKTGSWTMDALTKDIFFTKEVYRILECQEEDIDNKLEKFYEYVHPEDLEQVKRTVNMADGMSDYEVEYRIISKNGMIKHIYEKSKSILNDQNQCVKIFGIIQDITEQKEAQSKLQLFQENQSRAQRVAKIGDWKYDVIEDKYVGSEEVFRIYGVEPSEFEGDFLSTLNLIHPQDQHKIQKALEKHLLGQASEVEFRVPMPNGEDKIIEGKAEPVFDALGTVVAVVGTLQDITERKGLENQLKDSLRVLNHVQTLTKIGSWEIDLVRNHSYTSDEAFEIYGMNREDYGNTYESFLELVHPNDRADIDAVLQNPPLEPIDMEFRIIRPDQSVRYVYEKIEFIFDEDHEPIHIYGTIQDITEKKELERQVEEVRERFKTLIREAEEVFEIVSPSGEILFISDAVERVLGFDVEECIGKKLYDFYEHTEVNYIRDMIEEVLEEPDKKVSRDISFTMKNGKRIYLELHMQNLLNHPVIHGIIVSFRDVTKRVEGEKKLKRLSRYDMLTKLPNKLYFEDQLEQLVKDKEDTRRRITLFMLDVDSLRYIKNTLGYQIVEQYIMKIAYKLKIFCKNKFFLCHYSDNRFVIIREGEEAVEAYQQFIHELYALFMEPLHVKKYNLDVEMSIGVSSYLEGEDVTRLVRHAETALFLAKSEGKNKYKFYSADIDIPSFKHFNLRNDLRKAVENKQLSIRYQPLVNVQNNDILAAEALVRWEHPEWGTVSPIEFITLAEETGYIIKIGDWVLQEVCHNYKRWMNQGMPRIKVSVNISVMQFFDEGFIDRVKTLLSQNGLDPGFLIMEITESTLMQSTDKIISDIEKLKSYGIQIALDDFGTEYSSLAYLDSLNIDILKIDGAFIRKINTNEQSTIITRHIIELAKELKIKLVAEYVETWEQLNFLKALKCYTGQGYLFSKPLILEEFEKILITKKCRPQVANTSQVIEERRKYFRIKFMQRLETKLTILAIKGKKVNIGNTKVLVKDMSPGGLCFIANIHLPIGREIILQFSSRLIEEEFYLQGYCVWTNEIEGGLLEYGVEFIVDENKRAELIQLLNKVQIRMRKDILFADGDFISGTEYQYFLPEKEKNEYKNDIL